MGSLHSRTKFKGTGIKQLTLEIYLKLSKRIEDHLKIIQVWHFNRQNNLRLILSRKIIIIEYIQDVGT